MCYSTTMRIRLARPDEAAQLGTIEDEAGRIYASAGLPPDLEGLGLAVVEAAIADQLAWVATNADDRAIGFALAWLRPGALHLRELDVLPTHMRRGVGRSLVEFVCERAREHGRTSVTLTTFRDVAWNAPLYQRWGFEVLALEACPAWLADIRTHEDRGELRRWPRVAMVRRVECGETHGHAEVR
jgi:GNAT superfamily N-acetyltransferase